METTNHISVDPVVWPTWNSLTVFTSRPTVSVRNRLAATVWNLMNDSLWKLPSCNLQTTSVGNLPAAFLWNLQTASLLQKCGYTGDTKDFTKHKVDSCFRNEHNKKAAKRAGPEAPLHFPQQKIKKTNLIFTLSVDICMINARKLGSPTVCLSKYFQHKSWHFSCLEFIHSLYSMITWRRFILI